MDFSKVALRLCHEELDKSPWNEIQVLLQTCFPKPPCDVFERTLHLTHQNLRVWTARDKTNSVIGTIMLSPHSKGGHLENLAVRPDFQGYGVGKLLIDRLISDVAHDQQAIISLTTRIPEYFEKAGFKNCETLPDGSNFMVRVGSLMYDST